MLSLTRECIREVDGVDKDEYYASYETVPMERVAQFYAGGEGPRDGNVRWNMIGKPSCPWNQVIFKLYASKLSEKAMAKHYPAMSTAYWMDCVIERYKRIRKVWIRAQPKNIMGKLETEEEVESRMLAALEKHHRAARVRERRVNVSAFPVSEDVVLTLGRNGDGEYI